MYLLFDSFFNTFVWICVLNICAYVFVSIGVGGMFHFFVVLRFGFGGDGCGGSPFATKKNIWRFVP